MTSACAVLFAISDLGGAIIFSHIIS